MNNKANAFVVGFTLRLYSWHQKCKQSYVFTI